MPSWTTISLLLLINMIHWVRVYRFRACKASDFKNHYYLLFASAILVSMSTGFMLWYHFRMVGSEMGKEFVFSWIFLVLLFVGIIMSEIVAQRIRRISRHNADE